LNDYCFWSLGTSKRKSNMVPALGLSMRPTVIAVFPIGNSLKGCKNYSQYIGFENYFALN
jgi:hypothetical protein